MPSAVILLVRVPQTYFSSSGLLATTISDVFSSKWQACCLQSRQLFSLVRWKTHEHGVVIEDNLVKSAWKPEEPVTTGL